MIEIVLKNIAIFPDWIQTTLLFSWGIFLFLIPIFGIVKILQSNNLKIIYQSTPKIIKKTSDFLQYQIDDPIKFPKIERLLQYLMIFQSYFLSFWLFLYFILLVLLWGLTEKELTIVQNISVLFFSLACAYMSAALKTQGNRELIKARTTTST